MTGTSQCESHTETWQRCLGRPSASRHQPWNLMNSTFTLSAVCDEAVGLTGATPGTWQRVATRGISPAFAETLGVFQCLHGFATSKSASECHRSHVLVLCILHNHTHVIAMLCTMSYDSIWLLCTGTIDPQFISIHHIGRNSYQFSPRIRRNSKKFDFFDGPSSNWVPLGPESVGSLWLSMALQDLRPGAALESLRRDIAVPRGNATRWSHDTMKSSVQMILGLILGLVWGCFHDSSMMVSGILDNFMNVKRCRDVKRKKNWSNRFRWRRQRKSILEYLNPQRNQRVLMHRAAMFFAASSSLVSCVIW